MLKKFLLSIAALFFLSPAFAVYTITLAESGGNVVATGSGTLNTSGLGAGLAVVSPGVGMTPGTPAIYLGAIGPTNTTQWNGVVTGPAFGAAVTTAGSSGSGPRVGFFNGDLNVPDTYVSGTAISSTTTWNAVTLAGLGVTVGTYTYTWGAGANADSIVIYAGTVPPSVQNVPTLGEYAMLGLALLLAMFGAWQMRKRALI